MSLTPSSDDFQLVGSPENAAPSTSRWGKVGIATAVMGVMGVAAYNLHRPAQMSPVQSMMSLQSKVLRAIKIGRALEDSDEAPAFAADFEFSWNEKGADDPDAMSVSTLLHKVAKDQIVEHPTMTATFMSDEGKAGDLVKALQGVVDGLKNFAEAQSGPEAAAEVEERLKVSKGEDDDTAVLVCSPCADEFEQEAEEKIEEELDAEKAPKLALEIGFGRTLEEMLEAKDEPAPMVMKGVEVKGNVELVEAMVAALGDMSHSEEGHMLSKLASVSLEEKIRYKPGAKFQGLPTFGDLVQMLQRQVLSQVPQSILTPLKDLSDVSGGLKRLSATGDKSGWEVDLDFKNVKLAKFLVAVLGDAQHEGGFMGAPMGSPTAMPPTDGPLTEMPPTDGPQ